MNNLYLNAFAVIMVGLPIILCLFALMLNQPDARTKRMRKRLKRIRKASR